MIYLDYNATTPIKPEAAEAVAVALRAGGNPSSIHALGRDARNRVEEARGNIARAADARQRDVIFTSGGTEANNLALRGTGCARLLISAIEHDSIRDGARDWPGEVTAINVHANGIVDLDALAKALGQDGRGTLVSVMLANNETGVIQPVAKVAEIARAKGALVHCDAIQAFGKIPLSFGALSVDLMSLSAHKIGGPQGVGALIIRPELKLEPLLKGGGQELRRRSGTENVPGIAGFGAAALRLGDIHQAMPGIEGLRNELERLLTEQVPDLTVAGAGSPRLGNTSCLVMPGVSAETQIMAFDLAGICVSAGAACSSGKLAASHVLEAMGFCQSEARSAIRVSLGWLTTKTEIDRFVEVWLALYHYAYGKMETDFGSHSARVGA